MTKQDLKSLIKEVISESQVYVFGPMDAARSWISKHQAPKTKNGRQVYVVSAAEFQKAFPNIKPEPVTKMSPRMDYFVIDKEGDLMPLSQANIGSGLDEVVSNAGLNGEDYNEDIPGLEGATVIQMMKKNGKVYLRLKGKDSGVLFDAVIV